MPIKQLLTPLVKILTFAKKNSLKLPLIWEGLPRQLHKLMFVRLNFERIENLQSFNRYRSKYCYLEEENLFLYLAACKIDRKINKTLWMLLRGWTEEFSAWKSKIEWLYQENTNSTLLWNLFQSKLLHLNIEMAWSGSFS